MNRAERRRAEKAKMKANKTYNMSAAQLEAFKRQVTNDSSYKATVAMLAIPLMVLMDKYGFRRKRLTAFAEKCIDLFESFESGYLSLNDMHKVIFEETGFNITEHGMQIHIDKE